MRCEPFVDTVKAFRMWSNELSNFFLGQVITIAFVVRITIPELIKYSSTREHKFEYRSHLIAYKCCSNWAKFCCGNAIRRSIVRFGGAGRRCTHPRGGWMLSLSLCAQPLGGAVLTRLTKPRMVAQTSEYLILIPRCATKAE